MGSCTWCFLAVAALAAISMPRRSYAQLILKQRCPDLTAIQVDFNQWTGKRWYVVMSDPIKSIDLNPTKCASYLDHLDHHDAIRHLYTGNGTRNHRDLVNSKDNTQLYSFVFRNVSEGTSINYSYDPVHGNQQSQSWILDYLPGIFGVVFTCSQHGEYCSSFAEIRSRCPELETQYISRAIKALNDGGINTKNMQNVVQECNLLGHSICKSMCHAPHYL